MVQNYVPQPYFWTIKNYTSHVVHWNILKMDDEKLRLTGGPLDHRPNGRSKITSHRCPLDHRPFRLLGFVNLDGPKYAIWTKAPFSLVVLNIYIHIKFLDFHWLRLEDLTCGPNSWSLRNEELFRTRIFSLIILTQCYYPQTSRESVSPVCEIFCMQFSRPWQSQGLLHKHCYH